MDLNIVITTNGPGEISAWVKPVVERIRQMIPPARIIIALVPCPHSSGYEAQVSAQIYGATVMRPQETVQYILSGKLPKHIVIAKHGAVLHLGGDQLFSVSLGMRTHFPVLVYTENHMMWRGFVDRFLLKHSKLLPRSTAKLAKCEVIGDIMVEAVKPSIDSIEARQKLGLSQGQAVVALMPGSKPLKVLYSTAWLLKIADALQEAHGGQLQFILPQSPYTPLPQIREAIQNPKYTQVLDGVQGKIVHRKNGSCILTELGTLIQITPPNWHYNALQVADLSLTLPGTNTAELAVLGVPMVVLLPLNKPELLPLEGLVNQVGRIPGLGKWLKKRLIHTHLKSIKYISLPNAKADKPLVKELIGEISIEQVIDAASEILSDPVMRRDLSLEMRKLMTNDDAVHKLIKAIETSLLKSYPQLKEKHGVESGLKTPGSP